MKKIRIGNASGYWGDDPEALKRQVNGGPLDYITMDFLAEVTMSILKKQHQKDSSLGYAKDFVEMLSSVAASLVEKKICVISNAGGINPVGCAKAIRKMADSLGVELRIAVVHGDDILDRVSDLVASGNQLANMETSEPISQVADRLQAANVYFGARSVVKALEEYDPHVVVTGRVTDTGITLAPMIHQFGWEWDDWDKLASGIVAGHLIECGSQVTGGNYTDWRQVDSFDQIGYPVIEMAEDGDFCLTKHHGTGGLVNADTVREQLFYEMGNPGAYLTPDVTVDFSSIEVLDDGRDRVLIQNVKGERPTPFFKVSLAYADGYKIHSSILVSGPKATEKAQAFAKIFWDRLKETPQETLTEFLGWNACHGNLVSNAYSSEVVLRLSARDPDPEILKRFNRQVAALILSGPPGVAILSPTGRVAGVVSYWPALLDKKAVAPKVCQFTDREVNHVDLQGASMGDFDPQKACLYMTTAERSSNKKAVVSDVEQLQLPIGAICLARSGDKGDSVNIGLLARCDEAYSFIREHVTAQWVKDVFRDLCGGKVLRFELAGLRGLNFILENALGGGGSCTLQADAQGKTFSQAMLMQPVAVSESLYQKYHGKKDYFRDL